MALTLPELTVARDSLFKARMGGVTTFRDQNGELITYKSDSEMARALAALDAEIAAASRRPASTIVFRTSKGI